MGILLFGENGQVGNACIKEAGRRGVDINALSRSQADFSHPERLRETILQYEPSLIINAAAYTAVDRAEDDREMAFLVNVSAPEAIAKVCAELDIPLIHVSTDYVFDGAGESPYKESDFTNPINAYGESKLKGEQAVLENCEKSLILRTSWVFSAHGSNFVKTMFNLSDRKQLSVVSDQFGCPTYAGHIAEVLLAIGFRVIEDKSVPWGVYHFSGAEKINWHEFAVSIFQAMIDEGVLESAPDVSPTDSSGYPTRAERPKMTVLDQSKIASTFQVPKVDWKSGLRETIALLADVSGK